MYGQENIKKGILGVKYITYCFLGFCMKCSWV